MTNPKTALVTGGTFGIGRAAATALARQGLEVVITGRDQARASECFDHVIQPRASKIGQGTRL